MVYEDIYNICVVVKTFIIYVWSVKTFIIGISIFTVGA